MYGKGLRQVFLNYILKIVSQIYSLNFAKLYILGIILHKM